MSFTIFNGFNFGKVQTQNISAGGGAVGGWKELGRTTLGSTTTPITVSSLPDKRYYMVLKSWSGNTNVSERLNNDSGANYATRRSADGGADSTLTSETAFPWSASGYSSTPNFAIDYISNYSTKEKLIHRNWMYQNTAGAGTAPGRVEMVSKWANISNAINRMDMAGGSNYDSGSEVVVLGYDPVDTHTTNFWEELASVNGDGVSGNLTATFTSKKYLWIQAFVKPSATATLTTRLGNGSIDTGANYSNRYSVNGGTDTTSVNDTTLIDDPWIDGANNIFYNIFIINNASNEKLVMMSRIENPTAGAGSIANRLEFVGKWTNTSVQADRFQFGVSAGNFNTASILKVWGSN